MAWEARLGLKHSNQSVESEVFLWLNGLGSPFGIETAILAHINIRKELRLNGLGSPFGIETTHTPAYWGDT